MRFRLILLFALVAECPFVASAEDPIRVGAILTLTGNLAPYGEWLSKSLRLVEAQVNAEGGVRGRKLEILLEDSQGNPAMGVSAYRKLTALSGARFILTHVSSVALAIKPLAEKDQVIQIDFASTTPEYSSPNDFSFRTGPVATDFAGEIAQLLTTRLGVKRLGVLYIDNDFGLGMLNTMRAKFAGEIVFAEPFSQNGTDYRAQLTKLKSIDVDGIWLVGYAKEASILVKQLRDVGNRSRILSDTYSVETQDFIEAVGRAGEGIVFVALDFDPSKHSPFSDAYLAKYHEEPTALAGQIYDAAQALVAALRRCSSPDSLCVKRELMNLDQTGVTGPLKFDVNGDCRKPVKLKTIRNGQFVDFVD